MRTRRMLATAAVATVAVVSVTAGSAASAATGSRPAGKGSVAVAANAKPGPDKGDQEARLRKIAASLHVSLARLENALRDMKMTSLRLGVEPTDPRVVAVFAKDLGISDAKARAVIKEIVGQPGPGKSGKPEKGGDQDALLRKIAASLHVSLATLDNALRDVKIASGRLGADPTDPRVVAVFAKDLHIGNAQALKILTEIVGRPGVTPPGKTPPSKPSAPAPSGKA
ncbi:hypothetical protein ACFFWC_18695 [Plantactinospora siamensis]|uniref:DUF305 domain-containing protein n=1 Tax=Plantactinospora siamensis TaxID=555372 RepID=A0ABV6P384_9ACTN